ncbi:MAG: hypothetical protein WA908_00730 [Pontixanthobacter sp.]
MKHYPRTIPHEAALAPPRIPQFHAVKIRIREDGWTPQRQAEFIGHLAQTRSVTEAARLVGMARETAYRLRSREWSESFCAAWDVAVGSAVIEKGATRERAIGHDTSHSKVTADDHDGTSQAAPKRRRMVTNAELHWRVKTGLWQLKFYRGVFKLAWRKGDNAALLSLLSRLDRSRPTASGSTVSHTG